MHTKDADVSVNSVDIDPFPEKLFLCVKKRLIHFKFKIREIFPERVTNARFASLEGNISRIKTKDTLIYI